MAKNISRLILKNIEEYEKISHEILAYNFRKATAYLNFDENHLCKFAAKICNVNVKTVYLWLDPSWPNKFTLKALCQISDTLDIPLSIFLDEKIDRSDIQSKKYMRRDTYKSSVESYIKNHPNASPNDIAKALGITITTANRHMINFQKSQNRKI